MSDKNKDRNINAESHLLNGFLGAIPGALIGGPLGALASIFAGGVLARNEIKDAETKKLNWELKQISREIEMNKLHPYRTRNQFELEKEVNKKIDDIFEKTGGNLIRAWISVSKYNDKCKIDVDHKIINGDCIRYVWQMMEHLDDIYKNGYKSIQMYRPMLHEYGKVFCIQKNDGSYIIWEYDAPHMFK